VDRVDVGGLQFQVLGPLEVTAGGQPSPLGRGKLRPLLAVLLLHPNEPVSVDHIAERIWGTAPPASPRAAVQSLVLRLRQALGGGELIETAADGYLIRLTVDQLDLTRFDALTRAAETAAAAGELARAHTLLTEALGLWRGPALADVRSELLHSRDLPLLAERRRRAEESWVDTGLRLGRAAEVVPRLRELVGAHPLHERFWAQLMTALYRSGRPAEALDTYQTVRRLLADELGVDPGAELRRLHQAVLTGDASLTGPPPAELPAAELPPAELPTAEPSVAEPSGAGPAPAAAPAPARVVPQQLPPAVRAFTGRDRDLIELDALLGAGTGQADPVVITAIAGTAGVGKTALAAHWARRVADQFPDGQLWLNLRGYHPGRPMPSGQALTVFLRALGVPSSQIPVELDAQVGLYRSLLAGRRLLIVLDNASSPDQVRPLLPGAPGCLVLVTSRDELTGLVARDGAARLRLGLLSAADAAALLRTLLGPAAAPATLAELATLCARLPLALRIAADRINSSSRPVAEAVAELAAEPRLDALAAGDDPHTAARAVLSWSYQALPPAAAVLFRRLGLVPGADWDAYAAAALLGGTLADARQTLAALVSAHLVEEYRGRYRMHDLLREYAREHARAEDADADRAAVTGRLLDHYLRNAAAAVDVAIPHEKHRRPAVPPPRPPAPAFADARDALGWLDAERHNLVVTAVHAADEGRSEHIRLLESTIYRYLLTGGHHSEALLLHGRALDAAVAAADRPGEAAALNNLGNVHWQLGDYGQAADDYRGALALRRATGDRAGEAAALNNLGVIEWHLGHYEASAAYYAQALPIHHETANRVGAATTLANLARVYQRIGRVGEVLDLQQQALAIFREIGDRSSEANSLSSLGTYYRRQRQDEVALDYYQQAIAMQLELGDRIGEADSLTCIAVIFRHWGRYEEAAAHCQRALAMARELGHRTVQLTVLVTLGDVALAAGRPAEALGHHQAALGLAEEMSDRFMQARALRGLGTVRQAMGDPAAARRHWQRALELYTDLGVPQAEVVRDLLDPAGQPVPG